MSHLSLRLPKETKIKLAGLARRFGHQNMSRFLNVVILAMIEKYEEDQWESGLLHFDGENLVPPSSFIQGPSVYAFPAVAPARFWRYVRKMRVEDLGNEKKEEQSDHNG